MIYVIGGRGRLGRAIQSSRPSDEVVVLERAIYEDWWQSDAAPRIARFFEMAPAGSAIIVAAGLLDPALPRADHQRVNVELPVRVMEAASKSGQRVVTFGTVMERLVEHPNPYVATKAELGRVVAERAAAGDAVLHLQVHTLYGGGEPASFMFLGQLLRALREGRPFEMSPGRQLREYHHVDDDVVAVHVALESGASGVEAISHGEPCTLRDLASHVFTALDRVELLRVGARPEPPDDNYATVLAKPRVFENVRFRPALPGVTAYLKALLPELQQQA
jgi:nucleoside-diphosphate-sugar epimerase